MRKILIVLMESVAFFMVSIAPVHAEIETVTWSADAETIYDTGFMHMLMKHPDGGVCLFNVDLIENDSPGAGTSDKGIYIDSVWGKNRARKVLTIDDPRAHKAWLYLFPNRNPKFPLTCEINGHRTQVDNTERKGWETVRWIEFPVEWLKKGENVIDLSCPEAQTEKEGWILQLARADEYEAGGGDPTSVGETSYKSFDGGRSWKKSSFGADNKLRAEYSVRISLERHVKTGWLESPVIDLWKGDSDTVIMQMRTIKKLKFSVMSEVPPGSTLSLYIRKGTSPGPYSKNWEPYEPAGNGPSVDLEIDGGVFNRRYLQFKAILSTDNPLVSPVIKSARITADFEESFPVPLHKNIHVTEIDNPPVKYPSVPWEWEPWDRPELTTLRKRENLDKVIAGSRTELEAQMKLLDYARKRWQWTPPNPEYPEWDALSIVERVNKGGGGGMCIQENLFFVGLCMVYGWQGRLIGVDGHEVCEVWNDEYGKWIYFDAFFPNHILCDIHTGEPLSFLELHNRYLDYFYPDRPMDWATDYRVSTDSFKDRKDKPPIIRSSLTYHDHQANAYTGFMESRIMRMMPRNNFYSKPFPRPLSHYGGGYFWQGYVNWYDNRTPPRGQYNWYTDRPRDMWPDLNTVHLTITQGYGNDRLFMEFETYTPNFSHYEVNVDNTGWEQAEERWTWLLVPGRNTLLVRAVSKSGVGGKPSRITVNHVVMPLNEWKIE
ncbi:hypothetical protein LLG96_16395 [bacterium]|nr:hypothetical protein [bacterium]